MQTIRDGRRGFTLIELLVVLAIIAILMSLLAAAVFRAFIQAPVTQARTEIAQLELAHAAARRSLGNVTFIPSRLVLREDGAYSSSTDPDALPTQAFLQRLFGKRMQTSIDWNNDGSFSTSDLVLTGDQVLVFILGGIPSGVGTTTPTTLGFSTNPVNPAQTTGTRLGPFYEFPAGRLKALGTNGFLSFLDPYVANPPQPYVYLSSNAAGNDYNTSANSGTPPPSYVCTHVASYINTPGGTSLLPYQLPAGTAASPSFINPNGFQILCAGADGVFGGWGSTVGNWDPTTGTTGSSGPSVSGRDDQSNFSKSILGAPQS